MSTTAPSNVNWSGLSPRGREALARIALRLTAGYTTSEIVELIEAERDQIKHLPLPRQAQVSKHWVANQLRELRAELVEVSD